MTVNQSIALASIMPGMLVGGLSFFIERQFDISSGFVILPLSIVILIAHALCLQPLINKAIEQRCDLHFRIHQECLYPSRIHSE